MILILRGAFILLVTSVAAFFVIRYENDLVNTAAAAQARIALPATRSSLPSEAAPALVDTSASSPDRYSYLSFAQIVALITLTVGVAGLVIAGDVLTKKKKLAAMSGVFLGLVAGLLVAYALSFVVDLAGVTLAPEELAKHDSAIFKLLEGVKVIIGLVTCYICISMVLQTKDDFRFVVPYVEFTKQTRGNRPILLDTSVIIDGRIADIIDTKLFQGSLIVPKFVLNELQLVADSPDKLRRARGRRGLEVLQKLREKHDADVHIHDADPEGTNVDQKLVSLAREMAARVMTNDFNLNKIATLRGIDVINLNDLAKALRPVVLPGESMRVKIIKPGESPSQGVGYLEDGTMVVVENGRQALGHDVDLVVTSTLQTSAGRMIFGRRVDNGEDDHGHGHNHHGPDHGFVHAQGQALPHPAPAPAAPSEPPTAAGTTQATPASPGSSASPPSTPTTPAPTISGPRIVRRN